MDERYHYAPSRRQGLIFHAGLALIVLAIGAWGLRLAFQSDFGLLFLLYLIPPIVATVFLPIIAYRAYALWRAYYTLERNGIHLHWGARVEDIPMQSILWVRTNNDPQLASIGRLPLPILRWPGAVRGVSHLSNGFPVEYMAAESKNMVLIATSKRVIAISPANIDNFMFAYQRLSELGSLSPWPARSIFPTFVFAKVWNAPSARYMILGAILLDILLLGWVSLVIPTRQEIFLGFTATSEPVAPFRMLLLPLLNTVFLAIDIILGIFFYRIEESPIEQNSSDTKPILRRRQSMVSPQILAFIIWGAGIFTPIIFLVAAFFITVTS
ncbi:MAG: hypothetical protein JW908_04740 [Anaerolineales bacterium]|nr:hypothetical protein [Anaerolineales bacterium]